MFFKKQVYYSSSEVVSPAHPDRLSDTLAAIVINDIQKRDGISAHAAIEVFMTHNTITFGGEATTTLPINIEYLRGVVRKGFEKSGYLKEMRKFWTKDQVALASNFYIYNAISAQSPDIAMATTDKGMKSGFNDVGIFFSSADDSTPNKTGYPHYVASLISSHLFIYSRTSILDKKKVVLGPDNKVVITVKVKEDGYTPISVTDITVSVAHAEKNSENEVREFVKKEIVTLLDSKSIVIDDNCNWIINGTGKFVVHGAISDTSMTGRKISVNHPSAGPLWCNKMIGGGSLVKPAHASDLILNLLSRFIANIVVTAKLSHYVVVGCSCAIGQTGIQSIFIKGDSKFDKKYRSKVEDYFLRTLPEYPLDIAKSLGFEHPNFNFADAVFTNFFGCPKTQPWESYKLVDEHVTMLLGSL